MNRARPETSEDRPLAGTIALVAGATRGAGRGIAVALGTAGATVYCTGRTRGERRSEYDRPETIDETADLVSAAGGHGIAIPVDHLDPGQVAALARRLDHDVGRLDLLVNAIWASERLFQWDTPIWQHDLTNGLRLLRLGVETHLVTNHYLLPLLIRSPGGLVIEVTDGTLDYNAINYRVNAFFDLAKASTIRLAFALGHELAPHACTAVALTPGWLRSEMMLEAFRVTEANWRDAAPISPHFAAISESPQFVGRAIVALAEDPDRARWNQASLSSGQLARHYGFTDLDGSQPDAWRYLVEIQDPGHPADATGYR
jgi:NAD(P)-dependent dehydrogenase (short-subunit alcohol dehydrogenase family)